MISIACPELYPGAAAPRITAVVNILKRLILPGPVVYDALPKEVSGTIAPLDAFTKNRLILSLCSR